MSDPAPKLLIVRMASPTLRAFLRHMAKHDGAWLVEDSLRVRAVTLITAEMLGYCTLERYPDSTRVVCATITARGRAALAWGKASLIRNHV